MPVQPNNQAAIEFLQQWDADGLWILTAISTDKKSIHTATFNENNIPELKDFLDQHNSFDNIYFHVNPTIGPLIKKAERQDIKSMSWLHVDIDPRPGENLAKEHERAFELLQSPPSGIPKPTVIIFSGGGFQGFWKLQDPIPIEGDLDKAEDAKLYNIQLEMMFGADNCHNIDRIMRLPGTINVPDKVKKRKGRIPTLAKLIQFSPELIYPISSFKKSQPTQTEQFELTSSASKTTVKINTDIKRLSSIDDLPENVPDWVKVLIVQGKDPDDPTKYPSRSEALFAVCCELIRRNVDDQTIFSVITDPGFGISESILEKNNHAEKYALRQLERAHEYAIDPQLRTMNEKHGVISDIGGKCVIISETFDFGMDRPTITKQSFDNFRNRYMNKKVQVGEDKNAHPVYKPLGKWWLEHEHRRQYETIVFAPGKDTPGMYNLWKGFSCEPKPGDCSLYLGHIKNVICNNNEDHYQYVLGWLANCVQKPDSPGQSAIVLRGKQGTGKSFFAKHFGALFGRHFMPVSDPKHLIGSFNAHLRDTVVLFGDEAFFAGDKKHESILKMLITEEIITIEAKGIDAESAPNYTHLILASNSKWVIPAGANERRFFVLDVNDTHKRDSKYFDKIVKQLNNGGKEALLHFLLTHDLANFQVYNIPQTDALAEQKILSFATEEEWWYRKLDEGRILTTHSAWKEEVSKEALLNDYLTYAQKIGVTRRGTATALGKFLKRVCPEGYPKSYQKRVDVDEERDEGMEHTTRPYFYAFPDLHICRESWNDLYENQFSWSIHDEPPGPEQSNGMGVFE